MMGVRALQRTQQEASNFLQGMKMRRTERLDYRRLDSGSFDNLQPFSPGLPPSPATHQIMGCLALAGFCIGQQEDPQADRPQSYYH